MTVSARPSGRYRSVRSSARYRSTRRRPARSARSSRRNVALVLLALAVLVTLVLGAFGTSSPSDGSAVPASAARLAPASRPLPQVIALEGSLRLQMPVSQRQVTALGYHGADTDALPLQPVGSQANEGLFSRLFHGLFGGGGGGLLRYYQLGGGQGPSTGALDVGAAAGTDVFAPVDGTVVSMQSFILDGKQYGRLIQIQ